MNRTPQPSWHYLPHVLVTVAFGAYTVIFASYNSQIETGIASLATIPIVIAAWYFGVQGGLLFALLTILLSGYLETQAGTSLQFMATDLSNILRMVSLLLVAVVTGRLSTITHHHLEAIRTLERYDQERRSHTNFLELLNGITSRALKADSLEATLELLTEQITQLFKADDGFFAFWDPVRKVPLPQVAYGSMREVYPHTIFEPGQRTLTASVMEAGRPIPVPDVRNSPHVSPEMALVFPSCSMLGVPLIAQERRLGALLLGYNTTRQFNENEIEYAGMMGEQLALVLSKSLLLEEERKQVRQLSALHDVALASIETEDEDQLIEHATGIIGRNLFPDNFGIMLYDENAGLLQAHPSYRFYNAEAVEPRTVQPGEGITGEVIRSGRAIRLGDVRTAPQYMDVDHGTNSELCVPIKLKERILGVINAESTKRNAFTIDDERLLTTMAGQLATAIEQSRKSQAERNWLDQLAHSNDLIYAIAQITSRLESTFNIDEIIQRIGAELAKIDLTCIIAIHDLEGESFTIKYTSLQPDHLAIVEQGLGYPMLRYSFPHSKLAGEILQPAAITSPEDEIETLFTETERPGVLRILGEIGFTPGMEPLRLPLIVEENLWGILWIWGRGIRNTDLPILSIFARQVGISLERARLFNEVQNLALTDPLTGLHNRRSLFEVGRIEFSHAHRMNRPFSCIMLDLDHFKQINDRHGHPAGDLILQEFARRIRVSVRDMDFVARYGGEEIVIVLPETDLAATMLVAERLRTAMAASPMKISDRAINVTVSIGVAQKDENTLQLETLIARADQAMYIAKHRGRNRIAVSK